MQRDVLLDMFKNCNFKGYITEDNFEEKIINNISGDNNNWTYDCGASKVCIIFYDEHFVIKIPFNARWDKWYDRYEDFINANACYNKEWDYCFTELIMYNRAKHKNLDSILCKTRLLGVVNEYPIYIQEKASPFVEKFPDSPYSDNRTPSMKQYCKKVGIDPPNYVWAADAIEYYGKKKFNKLMKFIEWGGIYDLHNGNIGYVGKRPVIMDFSGFEN